MGSGSFFEFICSYIYTHIYPCLTRIRERKAAINQAIQKMKAESVDPPAGLGYMQKIQQSRTNETKMFKCIFLYINHIRGPTHC